LKERQTQYLTTVHVVLRFEFFTVVN